MTDDRTYLDWNATVPLRPEARAAMIAALDVIGNPSSVHAEGRRARAIVEDARERVAALVGANPADVIFTSGATEANATVMAAGWDTIFVSAMEHDSVLAPARASGARIVEIPATRDGVAMAEIVADHWLRMGAAFGRALVSLQAANSETGVLQPVAETAAFARAHGLAMHCDAVQAAGRIALGPLLADVEYVSIAAHKIGGPKGVGALISRAGTDLPALIRGGGQERRRRAGTENVAAIAGFGAVAEAALQALGKRADVRRRRDRLEQEVRRVTPQALVIGADAERLDNTACIALPGRSAETLVIALDLAGVSVSAGSACSSGKVGESHVLKALGLPVEVQRGAVRVSIGPETSDEDMSQFVMAWSRIAGEAALAA
jgi:cysteine desulfurase